MVGDLSPTERRIMDAITDGRDSDEPWGRSSPPIMADAVDMSSQHVRNEMRRLEARGYLARLDRHVYEITDDGLQAIESME